MFIQLDQAGGGKGGIGNGLSSPVALQITFGKVRPVQWSEQVQQPQGDRASRDVVGQPGWLEPQAAQIARLSEASAAQSVFKGQQTG